MARIQPDEMDLTLVGKPEFMCKQSRMLFRTRAEHGINSDVGDDLVAFAREKLVGASNETGYNEGQKLAILARRIPLDIRTNTSAAIQSINRQIAQHMRVLYGITDNNETLLTGSPSEPIISEGAKAAMRKDFSATDALFGVFSSPGISVGERGEMVAELLMILASDAATRSGKFSIPSFFECLLTDISWQKLKSSQASRGRCFHTKNFQETFENSFGNFNHIIKIYGNVPGLKSWYRYLTRRVAISSQFGQQGIDAAFPYTIDGTAIAPDNTSTMFLQTRSRVGMQKPSEKSFEDMDRIVHQMHGSGDTDLNPTQPGLKPVIRMIFSLKSHEKEVTVMEYGDYDNDMLAWDIYVPFSSLRAVQENCHAWHSALTMELNAGRIFFGDKVRMGWPLQRRKATIFGQIGGQWGSKRLGIVARRRRKGRRNIG
ncbi:hypothetical protein DACRYDRAFT_107190 [Dacryopinax primogenitus]|uniref:Uncharacterized protein n=1 Tax=Dacryopinax primogenitus (strain DJM 731) TaxID=1858805 RepID=M5G218_DACPD|nr:uncharacterized protein DACRYDRAFT_107190 [Dacryopinax primogenitus]EJU02260.1 hypothetical protein DACRYDRAFT_107190 [Dacryopinax primogenitus]